MRYYPDNRDNTPLRYVGRTPVYVTTVLTALYVAGLLATTILQATGGQPDYFEFSTDAFFLHGWLWQMVSYSFVNGPDIYFLLWAYVLYRCGVEIEQFFGRGTLLKFYALQLTAVVVALGLWRLTGRDGWYAGMGMVTTGFFVGFAVLYPDLPWFGLVAMKYVAGAFVGIIALSDLAANDWRNLLVLTVVTVASASFIRHAKFGGTVNVREWLRQLKPFGRPRFRVLPSPEQPAPRTNPGSGTLGSVDAILDKIARDGFASLTQEERDQLERARDILNKKRT
jgi:hypothetical protein